MTERPAPAPAPAPAAPLDRIEALLAACVRAGASDLHLAPGLPPLLRVEGLLEPIAAEAVLRPEALAALAGALAGPAPLGELRHPPAGAARGALDGAFTSRSGTRFRFNIFRRQGQLAVALRRLEEEFLTLSQLGMPEQLYNYCDQRDGLVVVTGPTGAGKSTTLATLLDRINRTRPCHIVTIEDPIEYLHRSLKALVNQRQIGLDAPDFNSALVSALRQDPDVILVGEIREVETIRTAITAAETGHLVFTTLHAGDCVGAVERLVSVFPAGEQDGVRRQLALVLRVIVAQHLLSAAEHLTAAPEARAGARPRRVAASEILAVSPAVANLIATGKSAQIYSAMESGQSLGMQTLEQDLARLWTIGRINELTAAAVARSPALLRDRAEALRRRGAASSPRGVSGVHP